MATTDSLRTVTLTAGTISGDVQYKVAKLSADNTVEAATAATDNILGVFVNSPATGEAAEIAIEGICRVIADGSVAAGDLVSADGSSLATTITPADANSSATFGNSFGLALEADAAASAHIRVLLGRQSVQTA